MDTGSYLANQMSDEIERSEAQYDHDLSEGIKLVSKHWPLSKFKRFITQFLLTTNDEDQWTFDYESYALAMFNDKAEGLGLHPMKWAPEFYQERWNHEKFIKGIESLGKIASGEEKI